MSFWSLPSFDSCTPCLLELLVGILLTLKLPLELNALLALVEISLKLLLVVEEVGSHLIAEDGPVLALGLGGNLLAAFLVVAALSAFFSPPPRAEP